MPEAAFKRAVSERNLISTPPLRGVEALRRQSAAIKASHRLSIANSKIAPTVTNTLIAKFLQHRSTKGAHSLTTPNSGGANLWRKLRQDNNPKKIKMLKLKRKIRIAVRLSLFLRGWWHKHLKSVDNMVLSDEKMDFLTKLIKPPAKEEKPKDILFDVSAYKANKHQKISHEVRRVLTLLPQYRSESEVHCVMIALRTHKQIANCPVRMQRLIAQYGELECFNEKRCVVKQGHPPQAFYYIFYGTVAVAVDDGPEKKVVCMLERGESFGELAIVSDSERQSSVISKTDIELISIKKEVYEDVFMAGGSKRITDPDHEQFIKSLDFLDGWPTDLLDINPKFFIFTYFQRAAVMVKDSNYSEWLYVIKSGSVDVLKKLTKSKTTGRRSRRRPARERFEAFVCGDYAQFCTTNGIVVAEPVDPDDVGERVGEEDSTVLEPVKGRLPLLRRRRSLSAPGGVRSSKYAQSLAAVQRANTNTPLYSKPSLPKLRWRESMQNVIHPARGTKMTFSQLVRKHVVVTNEDDEAFSDECEDELEMLNARNEEFCPPTEELPPPAGEKRTYLDDLDKGIERRAHLLTEADLNPQFVKVQTLTKGSTFGLANVVLGDQPSLCLVSNGAECIMINKEFYRENCSQKLQRKLLQLVSPYPEDEAMQHDLVIKLNWDAQRQLILDETVSDIKHRLVRL